MNTEHQQRDRKYKKGPVRIALCEKFSYPGPVRGSHAEVPLPSSLRCLDVLKDIQALVL